MSTLDSTPTAPTISPASLIRPRDPAPSSFIFRDPNPSNKTVPFAKARGLLSILSWRRPFDSEGEELFAQHYLDKIEGMTQDGFRNRHLTIPYADGAPCNIIWSCHIDTCHHAEGYQRLAICKDDAGIAYVRTRRGEGNCLGADDGTGVWIMLEMIAAKRPGRYIFHRGEERGCLGSRWIMTNAQDLLANATAAIAFDRKDFNNIITPQGSERGCSEAFAASIAAQLPNYKADDTGLFTDTKQYFRKIPECTNLSVGYQSQHGPLERQYLDFAVALRDHMLTFDTQRLVIERNPDRYEYKTFQGHNNTHWQNRHASARKETDYGGDPNNLDPNHYIHEASNASKDYYVWSKKLGKNLLRTEAVFVAGDGYVLKNAATTAKATATVIKKAAAPLQPEDSLDPDNELFDIQLEIDLERSLKELAYHYPTAAAKLLEAAGIDADDFLQMVYSDYLDDDTDPAEDTDQGGSEGATTVEPELVRARRLAVEAEDAKRLADATSKGLVVTAQARHQAATSALVTPGNDITADDITEGEAMARAFADHDSNPNRKEGQK